MGECVYLAIRFHQLLDQLHVFNTSCSSSVSEPNWNKRSIPLTVNEPLHFCWRLQFNTEKLTDGSQILVCLILKTLSWPILQISAHTYYPFQSKTWAMISVTGYCIQDCYQSYTNYIITTTVSNGQLSVTYQNNAWITQRPKKLHSYKYLI